MAEVEKLENFFLKYSKFIQAKNPICKKLTLPTHQRELLRDNKNIWPN